MFNLRVKTSYSERSNSHYYTTFEIEFEKPEIESEFSPATGTKIVDVRPVCPDLQCNNIYSPDFEHFYSLWEVKILTDEDDDRYVDYRYIAVPVEPDLGLDDDDTEDDE